MTEPFIASNGIEITMDPDREGKVYLVGRRSRGDEGQYLGTHATASTKGIVALREFFQHERDEELGRWRWPENPEYVVYSFAPNNVRVFRESVGKSLDYMNEGAWPSSPSDYSKAARAYFETHPERTPWEDAKPWETWILTVDGEERSVTLDEDREFRDRSYSTYSWMHVSDGRITAGRRIWPEDAS